MVVYWDIGTSSLMIYSKTSVSIYQTTWSSIPEDSHIHFLSIFSVVHYPIAINFTSLQPKISRVNDISASYLEDSGLKSWPRDQLS
jgi:hypothetical protein